MALVPFCVFFVRFVIFYLGSAVNSWGVPLSAPNRLTLYTPRRVPPHHPSLAVSRGSGQCPVHPIASPETADYGLPTTLRYPIHPNCSVPLLMPPRALWRG
jgi:hypothetical protein